MSTARIVAWAAAFGCMAGCKTISAEAPLAVTLGIDRDQTIASLRRHQYCREGWKPRPVEWFPRCERHGIENGDAWVAASFVENRLTELSRWERYDDPLVASERWNQLVSEHAALGGLTDEAKRAYRKARELPAGIKRWAAAVHGDQVVAVFLLTPAPPENASLWEHVIEVKR